MEGECLDIVAGEPATREPISLADDDRREGGDEVEQRLKDLGYME